MKTFDLLEKLYMDEKEFVTSDELKDYTKSVNLDYPTVIKNLERRKYLTRIFRGMFYVKPVEEIYRGHNKYNHLELVAKGLEMKGVTNWYFGLYTGLKMNNMTHEYFVIDDIITDSIFRQKPIFISRRKFRFIKIKESLLNFGIKKHGIINYSDPEKTILDFIYLWKFDGKPDQRIIMDVFDWSNNLSNNKLKKYSKHYPKSVQKIIGEIIRENEIN